MLYLLSDMKTGDSDLPLAPVESQARDNQLEAEAFLEHYELCPMCFAPFDEFSHKDGFYECRICGFRAME